MRSWNEQPVVFDCRDEKLIGILHRVANHDARLGILLLVGGPQYRVGSHRQFVLMARDLAAAGYPVMRFDFRGMGDSEGEPQTFERVETDIRTAVAAFGRALPQLRGVVLWGLCDAASAILMLKSPPKEVLGRILVNPWVRTEAGAARAYVRHYYVRRVLQRDFWRKLRSGALDMRDALRQFLDALRQSAKTPEPVDRGASSYIDQMLEGAVTFRRPTLIVLSGRDLTAREFEALRERSSKWREFIGSSSVRCVRVVKADHTFSSRNSLHDMSGNCAEWLSTLEIRLND